MTVCVDCDVAFSFEMGHLLDDGIDPVALRWFDAPCPSGHMVRVRPADVREVLP